MKRVGIDTNILIRLLVDDDPANRDAVSAFGSQLNETVHGVITLTSLLEMDWALRSQYGYSRTQSVNAIRNVIRIRGTEIEDHNAVVRALALVESRDADFADALIAERCAELECIEVVTLDRKAAARIPMMVRIS